MLMGGGLTHIQIIDHNELGNIKYINCKTYFLSHYGICLNTLTLKLNSSCVGGGVTIREGRGVAREGVARPQGYPSYVYLGNSENIIAYN